ncbi:MAG: 50S ribosomal protein L3 [bacterium]|nr:50S ribosomal protein L3 [bacterium]
MSLITGKKLQMSQIFKDGKVIPVTPIKVADISVFNEGELLKITGISRGIGFQGVVKRWGFHGGPKSHGGKHSLRAPGSIGSTAPQRVLKGRKMAGRTGGRQKTIGNLEVVSLNKENAVLMVKGAIPGYKNSEIKIQKDASHKALKKKLR